MAGNRGLRMTNIGEYLRGFFLHTTKDDADEYEYINNLGEMKRLLNTRCISIESVTINGRAFRVICAETQGESMHVSAINSKGNVTLRGDILIVASVGVGENEILRSITDEELMFLKENMGLMNIKCKNGDVYNAYVLCNVSLVE